MKMKVAYLLNIRIKILKKLKLLIWIIPNLEMTKFY